MRGPPGGAALLAAAVLALCAPEAPAQRGRAADLFVSADPADHPEHDWEADVRRKAATDSVYRAASGGSFDFQKVSYRSRVGDLDVPAYLFQPLERRGPRGHAALVWVHGGVHGDFHEGMLPWVREAVRRGYVVIAPEYRGSTGYGRAHHEAIDYGGYEIDDVTTAVDYLARNLPHVDTARVAVMGWSHGGFIAAHSVFREAHPYRAAVAIVPVTNLVFRLAYKGPEYQRYFSTQERIRGLPFERPELYVERSPLYQVDRLQVPILVHVATNDRDVDFVESEMLVNALRVKKPELAETRIYQDPPGGHAFQLLVDPRTLEPVLTPELRDSWNRTWTFLEWNLRPYEEG